MLNCDSRPRQSSWSCQVDNPTGWESQYVTCNTRNRWPQWLSSTNSTKQKSSGLRDSATGAGPTLSNVTLAEKPDGLETGNFVHAALKRDQVCDCVFQHIHPNNKSSETMPTSHSHWIDPHTKSYIIPMFVTTFSVQHADNDVVRMRTKEVVHFSMPVRIPLHHHFLGSRICKHAMSLHYEPVGLFMLPSVLLFDIHLVLVSLRHGLNALKGFQRRYLHTLLLSPTALILSAVMLNAIRSTESMPHRVQCSHSPVNTALLTQRTLDSRHRIKMCFNVQHTL